jgi:hypothetical protein
VKKLASFILISTLVGIPAFAADSNFSASKKANVIEPAMKSLAPGEKLEYEVYWMGFHVGLGTLEIREKTVLNGREALHLVAIAETNDFLSKLFPVHDEVHSFVDAETYYSLEFRKVLSEGRYRADEKMTYDYDKNKVYYESLKNGSKKEIDIPGPVQDFLSAFFWFRTQDIQVGESVKTVVNGEEKNWDLKIRCLRRETKELRGNQVYDTFMVEPKTELKGALYNKGRAWVHFTADKRRIPVLFTIKTPFDPVIGILKSTPALTPII